MHIIGGGVIGLCSAWYLRRAGYDVTVVDKTNVLQDCCSYGNAGLVVPSHSVPLAAPGVIAQGIRWMFHADSPFFIRPRMDAGLMRWLWRFYRSCKTSHVARATPILRDFHLLSKSLYREFAARPGFQFDFAERGSLMLYRTAKGAHDEQTTAAYARALGLNVSLLSPAEIGDLDPHLHCDVTGGVFYHDDAQLYPGKFLLNLQRALVSAGVRFYTSQAVVGFQTSGGRITHLVFADGSTEATDEVVLATGAWSGHLVKQLGIRLLMQDGKGYSVTLKNFTPRPLIPSILTEARVAVTPMGNDLRIGGTLEVSNFSAKINTKRVAAILRAMTEYYPEFPHLKPDTVDVWHGFRPVTADGLPYIGRSAHYPNLIIATGHAMLGMSLGPATGLLVSEIAQRVQTSLPIDLFALERHS